MCLGLPGALPVANAQAIESTIRIGLALNCSIATWCRFARKNYFYPDMPKNFQTSQYDEPLCGEGYLDIEVDGRPFRVGIERVHLEEDTGKNTHVGGATGRIHGADYSLVDYNRAGIPLVEIVTKPVPGTGALAPEVARVYVTELREILRTLGVSDVRMEQGSLRCDVNTSLSPIGSSRVGHPHRDEERQLAAQRRAGGSVRDHPAGGVLDGGGRIIQETRHFSESTGDTRAGRSKEEATDYRYFPEPDLVPIAPDPGLGREAAHRPARAADRPPAASPRVARACRPTTCRRCPTPASSTWSSRPSRPARRWPRPATGGSATWPSRRTRARSSRPTSAIDPAQVARLIALVADGTLSAALARQAVDGVLETGQRRRCRSSPTAACGWCRTRAR